MTIKRVFFIGFVIVSLFVIHNLVVSIYDLWHKQDLIKQENARLEQNKKENQALKKQLVQVKSRDFIETEARNKLFLVKPGEREVIMPQTKSSASAKPQVYTPNWRKWLQILLPGVH